MLPPEIRNEIARLVLEGTASAGSVVLLDERWRRRPVGLSGRAGGSGDAADRAAVLCAPGAAPFTELREGTLAELLARPLSVLVLADMPLEGEEAATLVRWVEKGGLLIRFAGPRMAEASTDPPHEDPLAAGEAAGRRPAARRRAVLEPTGRARAVPAGIAVHRAARAGRGAR